MTTLSVQSVWTLGPVSHQLNLRDLDIVQTAGGLALYGTNGSSGGVVSYEISAATGGLSFADSLLLPPLTSVDGPAHLELMSFGGQDFVVNLGRHADGLEAIQVNPDADLDTRLDLAGTDAAAISTLVFHSADTRDMVYAGYWGRSDLGIYQVTSGGALSYIGQISSPFQEHGADLVDFRITDVGGQDVLVFASRYQDQVTSYTINSNGGLAVADVLRMSDGLPVDTPSAMEIAQIGASRFAILASAGTSSLTVMEITATGQLEPRDHINASTYTRIENLTALDTVHIADRAFVVAGGANDGVSLFEVMPDGRQYHWDGSGTNRMVGGHGADTFILSPGATQDHIVDFELGTDRIDMSALGRIYDLSALTWSERSAGAVITFGDRTLIINTSDATPLAASSFTYADVFNLSHTDLSYMEGGTDPGGDFTEAGNIEGSAGADTLQGSASEDTIRGNIGDDMLYGNDGDDILNGGSGADMLDGGSGSDWASYEGARGSLRVDLMFSQINTNVASGDTYVSIENLIGSQGFDNLRGTLGDNIIQGGRNVDYIFGRRGDDTLEGGVGDDVLFGGVGADALIGGDNRDRAQYSEALERVTVDLQNAAANTGEAVWMWSKTLTQPLIPFYWIPISWAAAP